jgi:hypothetical protein
MTSRAGLIGRGASAMMLQDIENVALLAIVADLRFFDYSFMISNFFGDDHRLNGSRFED